MSKTPVKQQCAICGLSNDSTLETHHIVPQRYGGSDHPENLVKLCGSCHNAIEDIYDDDFYHRLSTTDAHLGDAEKDSDLGYSIGSQQSPDRKFPTVPLHINREGVPKAKLADWGILDEDEVSRVKIPVQEYIEQEREKLREQQSDDNGDSRPSPLGDINSVPTNHSEYLDDLEEAIEDGEIDPDEEIDVTSQRGVSVQVLHCGYCSTVFPEWEKAEAAKHLQIEHHIDDPYEVADKDPILKDR